MQHNCVHRSATLCPTEIFATDPQVLFYAGFNLLSGVPLLAFYGGWVAKFGAAGFFGLMLTLSLGFGETTAIRARSLGTVDVFDRLTYRHRYAKLVERIGRDALTGLKDRGQFDTREPLMLQAAARSKQSMSLMMIDILALVRERLDRRRLISSSIAGYSFSRICLN